MNGRPFCRAELDQLHAMVMEGLAFTEIARRLGRSISRCHANACTHGWHQAKRYAHYDVAFLARLREFHARGFSDPDIAAQLGGNKSVIGKHRRRLGLRSNAHAPRQQAKRRPTQFQRGCIRGNAARRYRAVGWINERRHRGLPTRWIKTCDRGRRQSRWVPLARWVWERIHGPVPTGQFIVHRNGDTLDDRPENLLLMDRRRLLAWQQSVRPGLLERTRAAACAAARRRHALRRLAAELRNVRRPRAVTA